MNYWLTYAFDQPELAKYRERLDKGVHALLPRLGGGPDKRQVPGVVGTVTNSHGAIEEVSIDPNSPLFPNSSNERFAHTILATTTLEIAFFKTPIDPVIFGKIGTPRPDIHMIFSYSGDKTDRIAVEYQLQTKKIRLRGMDIRSDPY